MATFTLARGFRGSATACGLKASGDLDLALIVAERPCVAAGVFTTNRVQAAPVVYDREILARNPAGVRAILANSGCANACTGEPGMEDARRMATLGAAAVGCEPGQVLVLSTGVIGVRLDVGKIGRGVSALTETSWSSDGEPVARAILTTDTHPKVAAADVTLGPWRSVAIRGLAKGAGMIHPNLATMLAVVLTDAVVEPVALHDMLVEAVERSFNRVSVDGDMSTNDTVLLLASGTSGVGLDDEPARVAFAAELTEVCGSLARQIARDGEGATRLVEIEVTGAVNEAQAHVVADAIARSPLVKTAIHGGDPNWGRVLAAAGASGVAVDPDRMKLSFGVAGHEVLLVADGLPVPFDARNASEALRRDPVHVRLDLGLGTADAKVWTCDLSAEYVAINAHYTT